MYCENCGTKMGDDVSFCPNCGANVDTGQGKEVANVPANIPATGTPAGQGYRQPTAPPGQPGGYYDQPGAQAPSGGGYYKKPKTGWLIFVLIINWITVGFIGIIVLYLMFAASIIEELIGAGDVMAPFIIGFLVVGGLYIWMTVKLANYSNGARIANIILAVLGLLNSLSPLSIFMIIIQGLVIYALAFDKRTVELFSNKPPHGYY
jgi:hypothetical protein